MAFVLASEKTLRLHSSQRFKSKALAEEHLEDHGWRRDGDVWIGPSTGSRVVIIDHKKVKQGE